GLRGRAASAARVDNNSCRPSPEIREQFPWRLPRRELDRRGSMGFFEKDEREGERGGAVRIDETCAAVDRYAKPAVAGVGAARSFNGHGAAAAIHLNFKQHL